MGELHFPASALWLWKEEKQLVSCSVPPEPRHMAKPSTFSLSAAICWLRREGILFPGIKA